MTTRFLPADISRDEGFRAQAYPDPLTGGEPYTCGFGCTGPDVKPGTFWTITKAAQRRDEKIAECAAELDRKASWWRTLSDERQDCCVNLLYNMGWPRLSGFKKMLGALKAHDYDGAARELLDSKYAVQVHSRALRLAAQIRTGKRP